VFWTLSKTFITLFPPHRNGWRQAVAVWDRERNGGDPQVFSWGDWVDVMPLAEMESTAGAADLDKSSEELVSSTFHRRIGGSGGPDRSRGAWWVTTFQLVKETSHPFYPSENVNSRPMVYGPEHITHHWPTFLSDTKPYFYCPCLYPFSTYTSSRKVSVLKVQRNTKVCFMCYASCAPLKWQMHPFIFSSL
jgi:hypothetical protein